MVSEESFGDECIHAMNFAVAYNQTHSSWEKMCKN